MGKRLNKQLWLQKQRDDSRIKFYEDRYDKYGARDPFLRMGQPGAEPTEKDWEDLKNYGWYGNALYQDRQRKQQEMAEWENYGSVDEYGNEKPEPRTSMISVSPTKHDAYPFDQYRKYVYGKDTPSSENEIGSFMDKKLADYEGEEQAKKEYTAWKTQTDEVLAKKMARAEYKRKGREVFGRASTYMGAEQGLVDDPELRKRRLRGTQVMGG